MTLRPSACADDMGGAATAIASGKAILITAGAGMGVAS